MEAQNQHYGGYERVWNDYAPISRSKWRKNEVEISSSFSYSFQAAQNDDDATYEAGLRKNYTISRNDKTEFDGTISEGVLWQIVEQNSGQISAPAQKTIGSNTYNFAGWNDGNGSNPRTITPDDNTDYTALYKVKGKSNDPDAFTNSSQRKFVRSQDGRLHYVYESMGKVWYEMSSDNGSTWQLMNGGKPLSPEYAKLPSLTLIHTNRIGIAFQEFSGITVQIIDYYNDVIQEEHTTGIGSTYPLDYSVDLNPVISYNVNNRILVIWQIPTLVPPFGWDTGLYYSLGKFLSLQGGSDLKWMEEEIKIAGTDGNSITPTLATHFAKYETDFHLAWEQNGKIKYLRMNRDGAGSLTFSPITTPSNGAGYSGYHSPSIIATDDNKPRLTWLTGNIAFYRTMNSSGSWSTIYSYHGWDQADNISINKTGDDEFAFAFSDMFGVFNNYVNSRNLSSYSRLNTTGKYLQVCNGNSSDTEVKAIVYKNNTFSQSNPLFSSNQEEGSDPPLAKINSSVPVVSGRQITLHDGETEFYYNLSDLFTGEDTIKFTEMSDSVLISSGNFASYLVSEPFNAKENGSVYLSVNYGSNDSLLNSDYFSGNKEIKFAAELIDEEGKILKVVDEAAFNSEAEKYLGSGNCELQLSGFKGKTARLRIKAESSFPTELAVCNNFTFKDNLERKNYIQTELLKTEVVKEYSLTQNFPNPFNPSTTITYSLPQKGQVVLKIYNILGQEVKTLVNEFKEEGIHNVNFDASNLPSGVYIYSIQANDFYESKKMILLK